MFVTVINDCQSQNDKARQETRLISLLGEPVSFVGVSSDFSVNATLEAAGTLVDVLDASEDRKGVVLLNVAPRGEKKKDGHNGTAFCYFEYENVLVISTVRGHSLSLVKKLGIINEINLVDVDEVVKHMHKRGMLTHDQAKYIPTSQFRSYDFTPRLAKWLVDGVEVPHELVGADVIEDIPDSIWYIDAFGNCKTTLLATEVQVKSGEKMKTNLGDFVYYAGLKDLSKSETALYAGSSGIDNRRFVEIATQMQAGSAAKTLDVTLGDEFIVK